MCFISSTPRGAHVRQLSLLPSTQRRKLEAQAPRPLFQSGLGRQGTGRWLQPRASAAEATLSATTAPQSGAGRGSRLCRGRASPAGVGQLPSPASVCQVKGEDRRLAGSPPTRRERRLQVRGSASATPQLPGAPQPGLKPQARMFPQIRRLGVRGQGGRGGFS